MTFTETRLSPRLMLNVHLFCFYSFSILLVVLYDDFSNGMDSKLAQPPYSTYDDGVWVLDSEKEDLFNFYDWATTDVHWSLGIVLRDPKRKPWGSFSCWRLCSSGVVDRRNLCLKTFFSKLRFGYLSALIQHRKWVDFISTVGKLFIFFIIILPLFDCQSSSFPSFNV